MTLKKVYLICLVCCVGFYQALAQKGVVVQENIFPTNTFPECHASTIVETPTGLVSAWFAGTEEKNPDVSIYLSRLVKGRWSKPLEVANGVQNASLRYPCWNPVLFQIPKGDLLLFYKVGPDPVHWWGMLMRSADGGKTWTSPEKLPEGILGPIKNKPVWLSDGTILCPTSTELGAWKVYFEYSKDQGKSWQKTDFINDGITLSAIQPSVLFRGKQQLQLLCRSQNDALLEAFSQDNGKTWTPLSKTALPNPNSGTDAVTLKDGRQVLVFNPTIRYKGKWGGPRYPLCIGVSADGKSWSIAAVFENQVGEFSYPAIIQTKDGLVHLTYTANRKTIKHVVVKI